LRVERFRGLLQQDKLRQSSIAALAMQCGFADAAHATRTFRNSFGTTPREFRRVTKNSRF
jgi:transcriptional regulator GlxA family with amidase domain